MEEKEHLINVFEFEFLIVGIRADGIIHVYIKDEAIMNRKMQNDIIQSIIALKKDNAGRIPAIVEFGEFISLSDDIVSHVNLDYKYHVSGVAIYAKNIADRILSKYYAKKYNTSTFTIFNTFEETLNYSLESKPQIAAVRNLTRNLLA